LSGLYIHIPFCESKCPYCAFESAVKRPGDEEKFLRAVGAEVSARRGLDFDPSERFDTLYVGGGTPSALSALAWLRLMEILRDSFSLSDGAEVTVEANPGSLSEDHLDLWRGWATRVSVGAQSFDDDELRFLGRIHDSAQAADALGMCLSAGYEASVDLMFGLPRQTVRDWAATLRRALEIAPGHISVYQLTIEDGTPFARENFALQDGYAGYRYAQWLLPRRGYCQYEVASFSLPGRESRHNLNYWADGDYVGIGPSAWSCAGGRRTKNAPGLDDYACMTDEKGTATVYEERLDPEPAARQAAVLALRTRRGIDWREFEGRHGKILADEVKQALEQFPANLVSTNAISSSLTPSGLRVANKIWQEII
jgi:oxygen-independent coproporphyrinogen-3 oxidase